VAVAQISPTLGDVAANLERHRQALQRAVDDGCQLVVFPELSLTGYRLRDSVPDVALKKDDETLKELAALSSQAAMVVGFVEEAPDHLFFNSAAYFEGGKLISIHRKAYLPTYGMFDEQRYFARGRRIEAFDCQQGRVAMLICEEMLHPSAPTIVACDGATMILTPSASPARGVTGEGEADSNARSWEAYNHVIARTYGVWVVYCNRVGVEDGVAFWGGSEIVSPAGETVVKAAYYEEDIVSAVLAEDAVRRRRIVNPIVRDEDLDLTINELARIRGRNVEAELRAGGREDRGRQRDDRQRRPFGDGKRGFQRGGGGGAPRSEEDDDNRGNRRDDDRGNRRFSDDDRGNRRFGDDDRGNRRFGDDDRGNRRFGGGDKGFGGGGGDRYGKKPFGNKFGGGGGGGGRFGGNKRFGDRDDRRGEGGGFGGQQRGRFGGGPRGGDDRGFGRGGGGGGFGGGGGGGGGNRRDPNDFGGGPRREGGDEQPRWKGRPRVGEDTPPRERERPEQDERRPRPVRVKKERDE